MQRNFPYVVTTPRGSPYGLRGVDAAKAAFQIRTMPGFLFEGLVEDLQQNRIAGIR